MSTKKNHRAVREAWLTVVVFVLAFSFYLACNAHMK